MEEAIFLGLRSEGIDLEQFRQRFTRDFLTEHTSAIQEMIQQGRAQLNDGRFRLTSKGYIVCDEICQMFH
jgi:coproporphyrinogen III oxidase-like Fe-S oxidoreductase